MNSVLINSGKQMSGVVMNNNINHGENKGQIYVILLFQ